MQKILVTGADGFIGSHLTEALVRAGFPVRAFVMYNSLGSLGWLDHCAADVQGAFEPWAGDIRDGHSVRGAVEGCDAVLHLAALIAIPYSYRATESYVDTNILGTLNVLRAAQDTGVRRVIHTSTSEVYGTAQFVPITEEHPLHAQSPYAATKIGADQLALSFQRSFGTPIVVVRPFNTYGPRQSARAVIPTVITQIANGARRLRLGATHPTRDFNYVDDTARGFIAALGAPDVEGETINLGGSFEVSVGAMVEMVADLMGADVEIETDSARLRPDRSEVERLAADAQKAKRLLDWEPRFGGPAGFRNGLSRTIEWFRDPANLSRYRHETYAT